MAVTRPRAIGTEDDEGRDKLLGATLAMASIELLPCQKVEKSYIKLKPACVTIRFKKLHGDLCFGSFCPHKTVPNKLPAARARALYGEPPSVWSVSS